MKRFLQGLRDLGYERPRVAVALLPLSVFAYLFLLNALLAPPGFQLMFGAMAACYLTAFIALASEWFWARWFASGLGWSGTMMGLVGMINPDAPVEIMAFVAGLHFLVIVLLMGPKMAARYDMQPSWRERFGMDEFGVARLRKAVTRASAALPSLIVWALAPKQPQSTAAVLVAALLVAAGVRGLVHLRTWGLLALGGAAALVASASPLYVYPHGSYLAWPDVVMTWTLASPGVPFALALLLVAAVLPFVGGAVRYYRSLR